MSGGFGAFVADLKRRHIYRVAAVYAVVAWILIQLVGNLTPMLRLPEWAGSFVLVLLLIGLPIVLIFAWIHGLPSTDGASVPTAASKLDWALAAGVVLVLVGFIYQLVADSTGAARPAMATAPPGSISIAVLPLANVSGDAGQEDLADGITDEIASALARVPSLRLVGRSSAYQFKGEYQDLRTIGQTLGATYLIEGSVRRSGDRVRVIAALIKADEGVTLWTEPYERELTDLFAIQEDIAQAIAGELRAPLGLGAGERLVSSRTVDVDSYQIFVRGRALFRDRMLDEAITTLESAVDRDPNFAPAWAILAQARRSQLEYNPLARSPQTPVAEAREFVRSTLELADAAAQRAIDLDPRHDGGYAALAYIQASRGRWREADQLYMKALSIDPNNPEALYRRAQTLNFVGRIAEAQHTYEQLLEIEPLVPIYQYQWAQQLYVNGRNQASVALLEATPVDSPARFFRDVYLARVYAATGRYSDASDTILALRGQPQLTEEVIETAAELIRRPTANETPASLPAFGDLAFVYAYVGAQDRMLESAERGLQIGNTGSSLVAIWSPLWAPARQTPRFKTLMREVGLVDYWRENGWPDLCRPQGTEDLVCD